MSLNSRVAIVAFAAVACSACTTAPSRATVFFTIDAPLCSSRIPVELFIDSARVATDTFVVNLGPAHLTTRGFETGVGQHTLSARTTIGYVWPNKLVTIAAGKTAVDTLPFYCS